MKKSKYDRLANSENDEKIWNRAGLTESQWAQLTTEEREIHYNRQEVCEHSYAYDGPDPRDTSEIALRTAYSFDPYFHTAHMIPHTPKDQACECQTCALKIGIERRLRP